MSDKGKDGGTNFVKIILIIVVIIVLLASAFFALINGIVTLIEETAEKAVKEVSESVKKGIQWLGTAKVTNGLPVFVVDKNQVENLKNTLEGQAVDTDVTGMTEIRLRKMLLAYAVSSSLSDTVCAVEVAEEDIINDFKEKNEEYKEDKDLEFNTILVKYEQILSSNIWNVSSPNYTLYYADNTSKTFFYFKDTEKMFGDDENAWFLGAMGATTISTAEGSNLNYVTSTGFELIKENFEAVGLGDKLNSEAYKQMLSSYTKEGDVIKLYTVDISEKAYYFSFENKNIGKIEEPAQSGDGTNIKYDVDADSVYTVNVQEINLADSIDLSKYAIPIELMVDLLNITGSGEFIETFIDYAITQIQTSVTAYTLKSEEVAYNQTKYNIDSDFVIEMYDIIDDLIDDKEDNFRAYYDIVYNRKYNGNNLPNNKVTNILNYQEINYNDIEYDEDKKYSVKALHEYLKTAYDPGSGFDLGNIEVTEVITKTTNQNKWQVMVSKIGTWYGDFTYNLEAPEIIYGIPSKMETATEEEYNKYNHTQMQEYQTKSEEQIEKRYLYYMLNAQLKTGQIDTSKCEMLYSDDIYDNVMKVENGADNREHFQNWAMRGLVEVAKNDSGSKNATSGVGTGIDYVYCKYKKTNIKKYEKVYKSKNEFINENNIVQTTASDDLDTKLKNFLELLRNKTGKIPTAIGSEGGFTAKNDDPSIVVKYADIYEGSTPVGDLLLDNGALMLFELLETSESTQELVNVFKYLAYLYTETDYGITDVSQIAHLFNTYQYSGTDFTVHTAMSSKDIILDSKKLKTAISKTYSGQAKNNLLNNLDYFLKIQENNNVNAVFAIAVATIESSAGTNWAAINSSTYNWFSIKGSYKGEADGVWRKYPNFGEAVEDFGDLIANGSYYFKAGKYTVSEIAPTYCNEEWGNSVISQMTKIYNNAGVTLNTGGTGGIEGTSGDVTTFTVNGRTYKNYKQIVPAYKSIPLACYPGTNLYYSGCAITSDAIIASGFGKNVTPVDVNKLRTDDHPGIVSRYTGKTCTWVYSNIRSGIIEQLNRGYPVMVKVTGGVLNPTGRGHFLVVLSMSEDGKKVYLSNPSGTREGVNNGWVNASILNEFERYMQMK